MEPELTPASAVNGIAASPVVLISTRSARAIFYVAGTLVVVINKVGLRRSNKLVS